MDERFCEVGGGIRLCYETFGDPADPALLLIMGLATQMVAWHEDFCSKLVDEGFHVIRFDNRDIGRSTHLEGAPTPTTPQLLMRRPPAAYRLEDMAGDTAGLRSRTGRNSFCSFPRTTSSCVEPGNGTSPASRWYKVAPRANTSLRPSTKFALSACS